MKFNEYLKMDNLLYLLERLEIIHNDPSITKVNNELYKFSVGGVDYDFGDVSIHNIYFITSGGKISRQNKLSLSDTYQVFNKVITCMIYFINDTEPDTFTFSTSDKKLKKMYKIIISKIMKTKPFTRYTYQDNGAAITFIKRKMVENFPMDSIIERIT